LGQKCLILEDQAKAVRARHLARKPVIGEKPSCPSGVGMDQLLDQRIGIADILSLPVRQRFFCTPDMTQGLWG
jgi:hypothetical protein